MGIGQGRLGDWMLLRSQFSRQFHRKQVPFQLRLLHDDFCHSTHGRLLGGRLAPSAPAIF